MVVRDGAGLEATSNPIVCRTEAPEHALFWGDIHGQTEMAVGAGSVGEHFHFARHAAALDFMAHCANDFQITAADYAKTQAGVKRRHEPGRFVTFLAYEWPGNTPAGGDRNVYFLHDDEPIHRSSHWRIADRADEQTDRYPVTRPHETFHGREDVLIGGRRANLDFFDDTLAPLIEIQSLHGIFWWFAEKALARPARWLHCRQRRPYRPAWLHLLDRLRHPFRHARRPDGGLRRRPEPRGVVGGDAGAALLWHDG